MILLLGIFHIQIIKKNMRYLFCIESTSLPDSIFVKIHDNNKFSKQFFDTLLWKLSLASKKKKKTPENILS